MNFELKYILISAVAVLLSACGKPTAQIPAQFSQLEEKAEIYPDYTDIIVPPNIAPLNFIVRKEKDSIQVRCHRDGASCSLKHR